MRTSLMERLSMSRLQAMATWVVGEELTAPSRLKGPWQVRHTRRRKQAAIGRCQVWLSEKTAREQFAATKLGMEVELTQYRTRLGSADASLA